MTRPQSRLVPVLSFFAAALLFAATLTVAHPHDEPEIFHLIGTIARVDLVNRVVEIDVVDRRTSLADSSLYSESDY